MNAFECLVAGFRRHRQSPSRPRAEAVSYLHLLLCILVIVILCWTPAVAGMAIFLGMALLFTDSCDLDLVRRCAHDPHNETLWHEFKRRYEGAIRHSVVRTLQRHNQYRAGESSTVVDDIVQDIYLRLLQHNCRAFKVFKGTTEVSWFWYLRVIATHITLNHLRNKNAAKRPRIERSLDASSDFDRERKLHQGRNHGDPLLTTDEEIRMMELYDQINYCLDLALRGPNKARDKLLFQLHFFDGLSAEEIATNRGIGMKAHAVEVAISRIRQRLAHFVDWL